MTDRKRTGDMILSVLAALVVFALGAGVWFVSFASLVWSLTFSVPVTYAVGAITGALFGALVAMPLVRRVLRLRRESRDG